MKNRVLKYLLLLTLGGGAYALGLGAGHGLDRGFYSTRLRPTQVQKASTAAFTPPPQAKAEETPETNQMASAFLPNPTGALDLLQSLLREWEQVDGWSYTESRITPLLYALRAEEYEKAWQLLAKVRSPERRDRFQSLLFNCWARKDARGALAAAQGVTNSKRREDLLREALLGWGQTDPNAALAWAQKLPAGQGKNSALEWLIVQLADRDPVAATRLLAQLPEGNARKDATQQVARYLAKTDPDAAAALLSGGDEMERMLCLPTIAGAKAGHDLTNALAWAQSLSDPKDRQTALATVVSVLFQSNPEAALQFAFNQTNAGLRVELTSNLAQGWATTAPTAAATWVRQIQDPALRKQAWQTLVRTWSCRDPEGAVNFITQSISDQAERQENLKTIARHWSCLPDQSEEVVEFAKQLPAGPDHDAFLGGVCHGLCMQEPEEAAQLATTLAPGPAQSQVLQQALQSWGMRDGEAAAAWATTLPDGPNRATACLEVTREWALRDASACAQWLDVLPADSARTQAAEAFVSATATRNPELAARWVDIIADETKRNQQIETIARRWLQTAPEAAQAWLQQTSLPDPQKEKLLKH